VGGFCVWGGAGAKGRCETGEGWWVEGSQGEGCTASNTSLKCGWVWVAGGTNKGGDCKSIQSQVCVGEGGKSNRTGGSKGREGGASMARQVKVVVVGRGPGLAGWRAHVVGKHKVSYCSHTHCKQWQTPTDHSHFSRPLLARVCPPHSAPCPRWWCWPAHLLLPCRPASPPRSPPPPRHPAQQPPAPQHAPWCQAKEWRQGGVDGGVHAGSQAADVTAELCARVRTGGLVADSETV
jgi:hypothetical protein